MRKLYFLLFFILSIFTLKAQGLEDWYAVVSEWAGTDPNAGQASFLSLLIPPGGRYQGMATAYTAVLKDSGYLEANPAGSSVLSQTELSVYHHDWIGESRLEGLVYTMRLGDFGFGTGFKLLYLPFTGINEWGDRYQNSGSTSFAKGTYTEMILTGNLSYNLFSSYYFHGLTLGGNLKFAYRGVPESIYPGQSAVALIADFGALTRFNLLKFFPSRERNLSLGVSVRNLGLPVQGDPLPSLLVAGIAYSPIRPLTLAFDTQIPFFLNLEPAEEISYAVGMDLVFTDFISLQSGINLKKGRPRATAGVTLVLEKMTINVNYTLDLVTTLTPFDRINLEIKLNLGDLGRLDKTERAKELYLQGLEQNAKGNLLQAINLFEESLELNSSFEPARESLDLARQARELQRQMEQVQTLPSTP